MPPKNQTNKIQTNNQINGYQLLTDFPINEQRKLLNCLNNTETNFTVYAKIIEDTIETTDNNDNPMWKTKISIASFIIQNNQNQIIDFFIVPLRPFRIRASHEIQSVQSIINDLYNEFMEENKIYETENEFTESETKKYDA